MLAARFYGPKDIRIEEVPVPNIPKNGALLKILAAGLCGTDKRIYANGHFHIPAGTPRVLGHEIIGEVVEIDRKDSGIMVGQKVTVAPNFGCGKCRECKKGYTQLCDHYDAFGISVDGGFAEFMAVPAVAIDQGNIIPVPAAFTPEQGVMIEISACSYRGLSVCNPQPDDSVLIIGGGAVTYLMCGWARTFKARQVIVSVITDEWGELSRRGDPDLVINSRTTDLKKAVFDATDGRGADIVIVACSAKEMDEIAPDLAAIQGRVNYFGGLPSENAMVTINSRAIHYREVTITGITGANVFWMNKALIELQKKPFDIEKGITHHYTLTEAKKAFDEADLTPRLKTIITCV